MTPPKNIKAFYLQQTSVAPTASQSTKKTKAEKAAEQIIAFYAGLKDGPKEILSELKTEGSAMYDAFKAYKDGNHDKCKQILKEEFDRSIILPYKEIYNRIMDKFK